MPNENHPDDVKLADALDTFARSPGRAYRFAKEISEVTTPLRLSNEALRERVKQLEGVLMVQNDKVCIHHNDAERVKIFDGCPICKLTDANERVKELEKLIDMILSSEGKGLLLALKEHQLKLAAASEVIEKCEKALKIHAPVVNPGQASYTYRESCYMQALAAIKEFRQPTDAPPSSDTEAVSPSP